MPQRLLLLLSLLLLSCGGKREGLITLKAIASTENFTPTFGDGSTTSPPSSVTDWPDFFNTPSAFRIGIKSAKLVAQDQTTPVFSIFDRNDFASAFISDVPLPPADPLEVATSDVAPPAGKFIRVQLEILFYEMTVPVCSLSPTPCSDRPFRSYFASILDRSISEQTIQAGDILFRPDGAATFGWLSRSTLPGAVQATRPSDPAQVPSRLFSGGAITSTFTADFPLANPLEVQPNQKEGSVLTLTFLITKEFFWDETADAGDPDQGRFNLIAATATSRDGKFQNGCHQIVSGCQDSADFWPGLPPISAEWRRSE